MYPIQASPVSDNILLNLFQVLKIVWSWIQDYHPKEFLHFCLSTQNVIFDIKEDTITPY